MIYFIGNKEQDIVKIGKTKNVENRLWEINTHCPYKCELFLTIDGKEAIEKTIHEMFNQFKMNGEWFQFSTEIQDFINNPKEIVLNPLFKDFNINTSYYNNEDLKIVEDLYKLKKSNIEISEITGLTIHQVRRIIRNNQLARKYREYKGTTIVSSEQDFQRNKRKKYRTLYKKGIITKEVLLEELAKYPTKRNCPKNTIEYT
jgi:hypothetical protein